MGFRWIALGIAGVAACSASALEPDNLELLVPREHAVGPWGGAFSAYGYVRESGDFYTSGYGASQGIRFFDVSENVSTQYVYQSDVSRMCRSDAITNGYFNADWGGQWYFGSLILNPTNVTYNGIDWYGCPSGLNSPHIWWNGIPGPSTWLFPVYFNNGAMEPYALTIDVVEVQPCEIDCPSGGLIPDVQCICPPSDAMPSIDRNNGGSDTIVDGVIITLDSGVDKKSSRVNVGITEGEAAW